LSEAVLVVDDDALFRSHLSSYLERNGFDVESVPDADTALDRLADRPFAVVVSDLRMDGVDGVELIRRVRQRHPDTECIAVSAYGRRSHEAFEAGAFWYADKDQENPAGVAKLITRALERRRLRTRNRQLQRQLEARYGFENVVGESDALRQTLDVARKVADSQATVLILGESGVGKELIARGLHVCSRRAAGPFVAVNCGAIPEHLLESELFGHVRGAFTGAHRDREGRFTLADGGTLFLDEIGDMSAVLQTKLLRVLQEQEFEPVGSSKTERVDVRIVAATNQDLHELMEQRRFREDLYFRLSVVPIEVPPLRERREDVPVLIEHFLKLQRRAHPDLRGLTEGARKRLEEYDWPGNVRQLESLIERLAIMSSDGWISEDELPREVAERRPRVPAVSLPADGIDLARAVFDFERALIEQALEATGWNKNRAAQLLGLKRTTLVEKIRAKQIER
jgi:DNA-binding NtrC family response regulator